MAKAVAVFLLLEVMAVVDVFCPKCKQFVGHFDGKTTIRLNYKCRRCNKLVVLDVKDMKTTIKRLPERKTSGGLMIL